MRRREFIAVVAAVIPGARLLPPAHAQTSGIRRIGVIYHGGPFEPSIEALRDGLRGAGLEEGRHFALLVRDSKGGDAAAAEAAARDLERDDKVDVIVAITSTVARAAKQATEKVPIVFAIGAEAVAAGLVESIAAPSGRLTGFQFLTVDLTAKRLEILREIVPKLRRIVTFYNPRIRVAVSALAAAQDAARKLGIDVAAQQVTSSEEIRDRLRALPAVEADVYFFLSDATTAVHAGLIIEAANTLSLPTMVEDLGLVRAGALAGYGPEYREYGRRAASYVARILAGARPGALPVEAVNQPALAINLKTAKTIGVDIPPLLLTRADEVIE
jgi:putative tryptophan/tyrosine transport system substrate-binding protein